ncbi:MAG TPA: hypothetical protein VGY99_06470 [Candidatus Binataceae bacterium]|jgi:hypothetical protein|nr:hypothetical protein [Candidatus Binataceae bacterium]
MKLFGILGAILVIIGFLAVSRPLITAIPTMSESGETDRYAEHQYRIEQLLGGGAVIIGFALLGLEIHDRK